VNVNGLAAPYKCKNKAPEAFKSDGAAARCFDQVGYETLTCSRDPIASGKPPSDSTGL
jgi:hypothetical protein